MYFDECFLSHTYVDMLISKNFSFSLKRVTSISPVYTRADCCRPRDTHSRIRQERIFTLPAIAVAIPVPDRNRLTLRTDANFQCSSRARFRNGCTSFPKNYGSGVPSLRTTFQGVEFNTVDKSRR